MGKTFEVKAKFIAEDQTSAVINKLQRPHDELSVRAYSMTKASDPPSDSFFAALGSFAD